MKLQPISISEIMSLELRHSPILKPLSVASLGFLLGHVFDRLAIHCANYEVEHTKADKKLPERVYQYGDFVRKILGAILPDSVNVYYVSIIYAPIVEEEVFRYGLQHNLLKRILAKLVNRNVIDHKVTASVRIIFTSIACALMHPRRKEPYLLTRLGALFMMGLITGTIQEATNNTSYPMLFHVMWNAASIFGKFGIREKRALR